MRRQPELIRRMLTRTRMTPIRRQTRTQRPIRRPTLLPIQQPIPTQRPIPIRLTSRPRRQGSVPLRG